MSDPNNQDEFEDDDLEPVWASPDDAEDDWDEGFDDGDEFADNGGDEFEASAEDDPFDDEYESEFGEETSAQADDDFDDDGFDEDFDAYEGGDEGYDEDDYDDADEYGDEGEDGDELAADGAPQRSAVQKYLPYAMMGGFGLFVLYMGYTVVLGGGAPAPQPVQRLPLTPPAQQTAAQNNAPAPATANNAPLPMPGQTDPAPVSNQELANFAGGNSQPPAGLGNIQPQNPTAISPRPLSDLASASPTNTLMPGGSANQIAPNAAITNMGNSAPVQQMADAQSSVLGELGSIGAADPLGTSSSPALPPAAQLPEPQPQGIGLSGSLGLSTNNVTPPASNPGAQMQASAGPATTTQMPTGLNTEGFVTESDLNTIASELRGNLVAEIQDGMNSLKDDLRESMQGVFEEEMVLIQGQINGLERRLEQLSAAQQDMAVAAVARPQTPTQPAAQIGSAESTRPSAPDNATQDNSGEAAEAETSMSPEDALQAQMEQALAGESADAESAATMPKETTMAKVVSPQSSSGQSTSRPPAIRRSAAPKSPPPVPMQKPGYFMAEGLAPQPGPFGARLPVQMADMRGQPNGLYQLRGVSSGTAWVSSQDTGTVLTVNRGDFLPGLGRVTEIRRSFNGWEVVTERGIVRQ